MTPEVSEALGRTINHKRIAGSCASMICAAQASTISRAHDGFQA